MTFDQLRQKYQTIIYHSYEMVENEDNYEINFNFEIV